MKAGFINFWRNGWVSLATVLVMVITLFVAFTVQAEELFFNEPPFDSFPITFSNPITPSTLTTTDITSSSAALSWTKNNDSDFYFYDLYRIISFEPLNVILLKRIYNRDETTFTDTLPQGTAYYYTLRTYNRTNQFARSNSLGALYVPYKNITIDGSISDWSGLNASIQDYTNDKQPGSPSGTDISNVYLAYDDQYFYARMDLADGSPNTQNIVYYNLNFNSQLAGPVIGDRYLRSQFFPGPEQNQSILRQRTSIDPPQAITIATDIAARGTNTLEMRTPIDKVIEKLKNGLLHFYVTASAVPGAVGYYDGTIQIVMKIPKIYPDKAVSLAKEILGAPYLGDGMTWGGKGYNCTSTSNKFVFPSEINNLGYYFYDNRPETRDCSTTTGRGVDCSGLSFWSYNRAFYGDRKVNYGKCVSEIYKDCPIAFEGADGQYRNNSYSIQRGEIKPGDLLFFDINQDNTIDHVAMYIGNNEIIHAEGALFNKVVKENLETVLSRYSAKFKGFRRVKDVKPSELQLKTKSPVELIVTDPEGITISPGTLEVPGMYRHFVDVDEDGDIDDFIDIPERKIGDYVVILVPKTDALPSDTYTLEAESLINGQSAINVLAENVPISDIPRAPYIIKSTETEIIPTIPTFIDFGPDTLNLKSKGKDVAVYVELPKGYDINQINLGSIGFNSQILVELKPIQIGDYDKNGISDLMIKFDREAVRHILVQGDKIKVTITGSLTDGRLFQVSDTIRVIYKGQDSELPLLLANLHEALSELLKLLQKL